MKNGSKEQTKVGREMLNSGKEEKEEEKRKKIDDEKKIWKNKINKKIKLKQENMNVENVRCERAKNITSNNNLEYKKKKE